MLRVNQLMRKKLRFVVKVGYFGRVLANFKEGGGGVLLKAETAVLRSDRREKKAF